MAEQSTKLPVTAKCCRKRYRCTKCGRESVHDTNHWGKIYPMCPAGLCGNMIHECLEPVPEGYGVPEEWKICTLGDLVEFK